MNRIVSRIAALAAIVVAGLTLSACGYNTIPTLEEQAKARWADVQNQYQRRADLIPNLVETVKGYATQEKSVLTAVDRGARQGDAGQGRRLAAHRSGQGEGTSRTRRTSSPARSAGCSRSRENYPDLKSNANFLALQSQLEGTENRIAVARRDYIEAVRGYNTALRTFPTVIWAKTAFSGNKPMAEFTATEGSDKPPQVKF